jgi:hypothetical protein
VFDAVVRLRLTASRTVFDAVPKQVLERLSEPASIRADPGVVGDDELGAAVAGGRPRVASDVF